ncbi:ORF7 [Retroperitoneal fibromatosis-associated herpesvirus]|uniref:ORF7 n=2 Tax=Retroperitoneal fibromatosis-associated herpesvirus TaxID=111469 RepID=U5NIS8_9GAMA|nr:ORF7 [Retroperitoneal fibromatosis-associated herpesvirus]AGY30686.1 ORF7 [Retroperitoneal fibromatosis-associated herpesvirus]
MTQELAAVYAGISALAADLCLVEFADPSTIDREKLKRTRDRFEVMRRALLVELRQQNLYDSCGLTLELEHLIENISETMARLSDCLDKTLAPLEHFRTLHSKDSCDRHRTVPFVFYGAWSVNISLSLINDIELFFKRLSSVFYCIDARQALDGLGEVLAFLGRLRGISPIPAPDTYVSSIPCIECLEEASVAPNQGESLPSLLANAACGHVCRPLCPEPILGLFENELQQLGINAEMTPTENPSNDSPAPDSLTATSLAEIGKHHIFGNVTTALMELSNLIYWRSGEDDPDTAGDKQCSHMAMLLTHEAEMQNRRRDINHRQGQRQPPTHFFDCFKPEALESIFCGGLFNSIEDTIEGLKKDCSSAFYERVNYAAAIQKQNEFYVRLSRLLTPDSDPGVNHNERLVVDREVITGKGSPDEVLRDARRRKDQYLQKVTRDGFRKLTECLKNQSRLLTETLRLRIWGSVIYREAAVLQNHFLVRSRFTSQPWQDHTTSKTSLFENSKYLKNSLYGQRLGNEHVELLTQQFYRLITGPLSRRHTMFPHPPNVGLAQCFEAAGMLPHQKLMVSEMIWPTIEPKDWIDPNFNMFYEFKEGDLNATQRRAWEFIRELILSVSLYNRTWEKNLKIFLTEAGEVTEQKPGCAPSGIYVTYETGKPLVLIGKKDGWIFKDIYALLYHHLQLGDHNGP